MRVETDRDDPKSTKKYKIENGICQQFEEKNEGNLYLTRYVVVLFSKTETRVLDPRSVTIVQMYTYTMHFGPENIGALKRKLQFTLMA